MKTGINITITRAYFEDRIGRTVSDADWKGIVEEIEDNEYIVEQIVDDWIESNESNEDEDMDDEDKVSNEHGR